ncbi:glycosyltransferase family 2 protein [Alicyclobacillus cycloheptanicus]|uniref:glycosyltransferase family 2 protein n=1 Tax=Alicyclobacillus cycloheptanicus TaxID=1457 RepID=UPI002377DE6C|nr:glycosyltransferase family 2 protein [Alicyclobacillus cycloheptanicus]WDM00472.1 glycosyltransferase family 2 protein [Alicyclobacillus cycloheptanicus]
MYPPLGYYPAVSILIPAHNEEKVLEKTLEAMVKLDYPGDLEILVLNDSSTDATGEIIQEYARFYRRVQHVRVPEGYPKGKARVLNHGLSVASGELIAVYDADNQPEPNALRLLADACFGTEGAVGAVGYVKTINEQKNWLTRMIAIEFSVFQLLMQSGRWTSMRLGSLTGTNMLVTKEALKRVGGWDVYALAEDADLTLKLTAIGGLLPVVPESRTWEQEPEKFSVWFRQRTRWMQGNLYLIAKIFRVKNWRRGRVLGHSIQQLSVYIMFVFFLLVSDVWFVLGEFGLVHTTFSVPLLLLWFESLLFYIVQLLSAETIDGLISVRNIGMAVLMYFTYAQLWVILLMWAWWKQLRMRHSKAMPVWDKTRIEPHIVKTDGMAFKKEMIDLQFR